MEAEQPAHEPLVRALFASAGITPSDEELAVFVLMYPLLRQKVERIYELDLADRP
jgi:hypothetical protein